MDLREIEQIMKTQNANGADGIMEKKEALISTIKNNKNNENDDSSTTPKMVDSGAALQLFFDHIPISSIPGINNFTSASASTTVELRTHDYVKDAIHLLHENNISGAPLTDIEEPDSTTKTHSDPYIGFINFHSIFLWALEECEAYQKQTKDECVSKLNIKGFFSMLQQIPHIGQTKIGELAKSFLWDPYFPVQLEETLFHVLLLLSKHRLHVVPVIERVNYKIMGFVTEHAVIHMLLQSSGLEWFDSIANKNLKEFRFENYDRVASISGDISIATAMHTLWKSQVGALAVEDKETHSLIGCVRYTDVHLLLDHDDLFINRENITVEQFIHLDTCMEDNNPGIERDICTLLSAGRLALRNMFIPRMDSPVTNKYTDTLKQAIQRLAETSSSFTFLVDKSQQVRGILTLRDIIIQFAPPGMDSRIDGGGFFRSALGQSGFSTSKMVL